MKKDENVDFIRQMEQMEATMRDFAPLVASYYRGLVENGLPSELAAQLTINWHNLWWRAGLNLHDK